MLDGTVYLNGHLFATVTGPEGALVFLGAMGGLGALRLRVSGGA